MGKSTISMAIFNSYVRHYQRVLGILAMCSSRVASLMSHDSWRLRLELRHWDFRSTGDRFPGLRDVTRWLGDSVTRNAPNIWGTPTSAPGPSTCGCPCRKHAEILQPAVSCCFYMAMVQNVGPDLRHKQMSCQSRLLTTDAGRGGDARSSIKIPKWFGGWLSINGNCIW